MGAGSGATPFGGEGAEGAAAPPQGGSGGEAGDELPGASFEQQVAAAQARAKSQAAQEFVRAYNLQRASGMGMAVDPKVGFTGAGLGVPGWPGSAGVVDGGWWRAPPRQLAPACLTSALLARAPTPWPPCADDGGCGACGPHQPPVHVCPRRFSGHQPRQYPGGGWRAHHPGERQDEPGSCGLGNRIRWAANLGAVLLVLVCFCAEASDRQSCSKHIGMSPSLACLACLAAALRLQEAGRSAGMLALAVPPSVAMRGGFAAADAVFDGYGAGGGLTWWKAKLLLQKKRMAEGGGAA